MPTRGLLEGRGRHCQGVVVCILRSARAGRIGDGRGPGTDARESCDACGPAVALHGGGDLPISRAMRREQSHQWQTGNGQCEFLRQVSIPYPSPAQPIVHSWQISRTRDARIIDGARARAMPSSTAAEEVDDALVVDLSGTGLVEIEPPALRPELVELVLMFNRIERIEHLDSLRSLRRLSLRANRVHKLEGVGSCVALRELELYENQLETIEGLDGLAHLEVLDLSFNKIAKIDGLERAGLDALRELYLASNQICAIEGLGGLPSLRLLELGSNKIRSVSNVAHLNSLEELHLGRNKITALGEIPQLPKLALLGLASNRLRTLDGLGAVATLRELYADHNGIDAMGALSGLSRLHTLDLSCNRLAAVECATLTALEELWLNENPIESAADLADLARLTGLRTIYLAGSPIAQSPDYRAELCRLVPSLHQLDADAIAPRVGESSL